MCSDLIDSCTHLPRLSFNAVPLKWLTTPKVCAHITL